VSLHPVGQAILIFQCWLIRQMRTSFTSGRQPGNNGDTRLLVVATVPVLSNTIQLNSAGDIKDGDRLVIEPGHPMRKS